MSIPLAGRHIETLRDDYLEGIALPDRALGRVDRRFEILARGALANLRRILPAGTEHRRREGRRELSGHRVEAIDRAIVGRVHAVVRAVEVPRDRHQVHGAGGVVNGRDLGGEHQCGVRNIGFPGSGRHQGGLPLGDNPPPERPDERAAQWRHSLDSRSCELLKRGVDNLKDAPLTQGSLGMGTHPLRPAVTGHDRSGTRGTNEGPASPGSAVFGGFEDEAPIVSVGKLAVDTDRAELVGEHPPNDGDHAPRARKGTEDIARRPRLSPFEAHGLTLMRRRRDTHGLIVPFPPRIGPPGPR